MQGETAPRNFFRGNAAEVIAQLGKEPLRQLLTEMLLIRNFEVRAEAAYLQGKVGGFFHSYIGQEAIQTAAISVFGRNNWFITSYRCHAMALLLGATPNELMAELFGRKTGNAKGRGGSMHFYTERMLGGFGIVTGQLPIATGAAFSLKYQGKKDEVALCFLGDGAVAQGSFHESLNLASLWNLPCIYVIENNQWGMGTPVSKAVCVSRLAEDIAPSYNMKGYSINGMDLIDCLAAFQHIRKEVLETSRPVLVEAVTERFKGHSISDPGLYRSKDVLKEAMGKDPLAAFQKILLEAGIVSAEEYKEIDAKQREIVLAALDYAENSPWPDAAELEEDVFAPEKK
jgi:pyruvate dehydrogenase E1 component alpha subunit